MTFAIPYAASSTVATPPILGEYTSMLFQVQQNSASLARSQQMHFEGIGGLSDKADQN
jgi:hypothetical protein